MIDISYKRILLKLLSPIGCALGDLVSYGSGGVVIFPPDHGQNGSGIHPTMFETE
jgi:hypothetical protein